MVRPHSHSQAKRRTEVVLQGCEGGCWVFPIVSPSINLHSPVRGTAYHDLGHCFELAKDTELIS